MSNSSRASSAGGMPQAGRAAGIDKRIFLHDAAAAQHTRCRGPSFSLFSLCMFLSLGPVLGPCTCLFSITQQSTSLLPPPALLFPEARLCPSLLERSLTTGCQAIARVGSLDHIAIPSAMRRFFADTSPVDWRGSGKSGSDCPGRGFLSTKKTDADAKNFQCPYEEGRWLCDFFA